jgi:hypothetical protein
MEGILLLGEEPRTEIRKADNWDAIGDQYRRAGDPGSAKAAYTEALQAMQRAPRDEAFTEEAVQVRVGEIRSKLRLLKALGE